MRSSPETILKTYHSIIAQAFPDPTDDDSKDGIRPCVWFAALRGYLSLLHWSGVMIYIGTTHRIGLTAQQLSLQHVPSQSMVSIAIDAGLVLFNHESIGQDGSRMIRDVVGQLINESVPISEIHVLGQVELADRTSVLGLLRVAYGCLADFHKHWQQPNTHTHTVVPTEQIKTDQIRHQLTQLQACFTYTVTNATFAMPTPILIDVAPESDASGVDLSFIFETKNSDLPSTPIESDKIHPQDRKPKFNGTLATPTKPIELDVAKTKITGKQQVRPPKQSVDIAFPDQPEQL